MSPVMPSGGRSLRRPGRLFVLFFAGALVCPELFIARAEDKTLLEHKIEAHLRAGEFAPALRMAQAAPAEQRDARLKQVAVAQSRAGMGRFGLETASEIGNDVVRDQTLRTITSEPIRGGARGGANAADFQSLIDLITSTVAPDSWDDVGGEGSIQEFPLGVDIDPRGTILRLPREDASDRLTGFLRTAAASRGNTQARETSALRKISLPRLEKQIQLRLAQRLPLDEEMLVLAGLERIQYVLVYPETGDLVVAGPAGEWKTDQEGRIVNAEHGGPVVRLDDLIAIWRHTARGGGKRFGCSINPRAENLAKAKAFLEANSDKPLPRTKTAAWLNQAREHVGRQDVEIFGGLDPGTRAAQVLVEADYHMKLIGIGLREGIPKVPSYFELVDPSEPAPALEVLRWWFAMNYEAIASDRDRRVFEIRGQGVQLHSENEWLTARGEQVHTGKSEPLNREFAANFTLHFSKLAAKYPIYAELRNIFDLALAAALVREERLDELVGWHALCFTDPEQPLVPLAPPLTEVESVSNHRVLKGGVILAAVSGGVTVDPASFVGSKAIVRDQTGKLESQRGINRHSKLERTAWWWD